MPRDSSPVLAPLAPKRQPVLYARWRPPVARLALLSWLMSCGPREVSLALISLLLASQPSEPAPKEVLCRPPREASLLARVLSVC